MSVNRFLQDNSDSDLPVITSASAVFRLSMETISLGAVGTAKEEGRQKL